MECRELLPHIFTLTPLGVAVIFCYTFRILAFAKTPSVRWQDVLRCPDFPSRISFGTTGWFVVSYKFIIFAEISKHNLIMKKFLRLFLFVILAILVISAIWGYPTYKAIYSPNVPSELEEKYIHVPNNSTYEDVVKILSSKNLILNESSFRKVAGYMKFDQRQNMRSGRFELTPNMTNRELIQMLRSGKQSPVKVTISYARLPEDIAGKVSKVIEADSLEILLLMQDPTFLKKYGFNAETAMSGIIPNTYEFFWNTDARGFWKRMVKEHKAFWTAERLAKAEKLRLNPEEVYTLASIVESETNYNPEKPRVAGVYLNRLKINMLLQADPTLVFATRDFETKRVTNVHKAVESPYNTYKYVGLPPGPIKLASISSIDAVLNPEEHKYYYFCAKPPANINDKPREHAFAKNLSQHNANAQKYYAYLRKAGIR